MKLTDLAKKVGLTSKDLREKLKELGFEIKATAKTVDDEVAELVIAELAGPAESLLKGRTEEEMNVAEVYDELINQKIEKEIVKSQRKKMAGKDTSKKGPEVSASISPAASVSKIIDIGNTVSVKELAEKSGVSVAKIIGELMKNGILANINQQIDFETVLIISDDLGIKVRKKHGAASADELLGRDISNLVKEADETVLKKRPPVVVVMGHVDHGKTKLLDAIRKTDVVSGESGGITQHIGAYQVSLPAKEKGKPARLITFLDTPGHEAFTEMRARGAHVTDIAILVVAADEGVKPQTIEALNHAKEANVPIIVALNKMDKPNVNLDRVKGELGEHGLIPEEWGGKTIMVPISALTGQGVPDLLEMILLVADIANLRANPDRPAVGTVVEAHLDQSLGPVATILVNTGTLKQGDSIVVGSAFGKVKLMIDSAKKRIESAPPSTPVQIAGLGITPLSGDILQVVAGEKFARLKAEEIQRLVSSSKDGEMVSNANKLINHVKSNKLLKVVLKADTKGSLEAIKNSLAKITDEEVALKIIHSGVGAISESDIMMAGASKGCVIGFHVDFDSSHAKQTAEREKVEVKTFKIIYELTDTIKNILAGYLEPEVMIVELGRARIEKIFWTKGAEIIVGCKVLTGTIEKNSILRVLRDKVIISEAEKMASLQRGQNAIDNAQEGEECGIKYSGKLKLMEGDILEAYKKVEKHRGLGELIEKPI